MIALTWFQYACCVIFNKFVCIGLLFVPEKGLPKHWLAISGACICMKDPSVVS